MDDGESGKRMRERAKRWISRCIAVWKVVRRTLERERLSEGEKYKYAREGSQLALLDSTLFFF